MSVRVRFAPSPTGPLHIGGVRTALYNYLFARNQEGQFLLRLEDTDQDRYVPGAEAYILEALRWCGIEPDEGPHKPGSVGPYRQSERKPDYRQYVDRLVANDRAYYAFDTSEELDAMRERLKAAGNKTTQYNYITRGYMANSLALPRDEVQRRLDAGDPYVIRMKMPRQEEIRFEDQIRGWVVVNTSTLDDKVLLKSDGMPTYHLANVVDDYRMGITHVIRGEEWLPSTPLHVLLYRALEWERPEFAHLPLILKPEGNGKLSKRDGDKHGFPVFPLEWTDPATGNIASGYRESGYLPEAVLNYLAFLGWNPGSDQELFSLAELEQAFSLERVGKAGVKFDKAKAEWYNAHYIRQRPVQELLPLVKETIGRQMADHPHQLPSDQRLIQALHLLHDRVTLLTEFYTLAPFFFGAPLNWDPQLVAKKWKPEQAPLLEAVKTSWSKLPEDQWTAQQIKAATETTITEAGGKFGKLMPVLRFAVTSRSFGPDLFDSIAWLGKPAAVANLEQGLAALQNFDSAA